MKLILLDTETTGVTANDKVCEIAWLEIDEDLNVINSDTSLINPEKHIPSGASAVNGITDRMVANAPTLEEYIDISDNPFGDPDTLFIAHNAPFDMKFIKRYIHPSSSELCTLRLAQEVWPEADSYKQSALAIQLGIEFAREDIHSAQGDLRVLLEVFRAMLHHKTLVELIELDGLIRLDPPMMFGKHKGTKISKLPGSYARWLKENVELDEHTSTALKHHHF